MKPLRLKRLPENIRREIRRARKARGWSQLELGRRAGLSQRHVSGIETGGIAPRYDTLIEVLRVLERDLVLVPRTLLPAVQALVREHRNRDAHGRDAHGYARHHDGYLLHAAEGDGEEEDHGEREDG